jgi:hypothetical protein
MNVRAQWLSGLLSTAPADRAAAEAGLKQLYAAAGLPEPRVFFWFASPFGAATASALLCAAGYPWRPMVETMERSKKSKEWVESVRAEMLGAAGASDWAGVAAAAGASLTMGHMMGMPPKMLQQPVTMTRIGLYPDIPSSSPVYDEKDPLFCAEKAYRNVLSGQGQWSLINPMLGQSFYNNMAYATQAKDAAHLAGRQVPPVLAGLWQVAKSAGLWWPFEHAVIISDRPSELHLDEQSRPHRGDGPAIIFRDGQRAWAWEGRAMREEWIERPEKIPQSEFKRFEKSFRDYMSKRRPKPAPAPKVSAIFKRELPMEPGPRLAVLREHNGGKLPLFDRYLAGEHEKTWQELIALGQAVREDPHAADALAVAYETMRRVEANVRTVTERLKAMRYKFRHKPHVPPGAKTLKQIAKAEKTLGAIPLSLRAFYEIVGAVDWTGVHPALAREGDTIASDPLVVYSAGDALENAVAEEENTLIIAPDDLHKANVSGGSPYEMEAGNLGADGKLMNERHDLNFVEYLRLVCRFGGFPGYEGLETGVPIEVEALKSDLLSF